MRKDLDTFYNIEVPSLLFAEYGLSTAYVLSFWLASVFLLLLARARAYVMIDRGYTWLV